MYMISMNIFLTKNLDLYFLIHKGHFSWKLSASNLNVILKLDMRY